MTTKQAAVRLECSPATVYALVAADRLRCYRVGLGRGAIRITEEHIMEYLARHTFGPADEAVPVAPRRVSLKHLRRS